MSSLYWFTCELWGENDYLWFFFAIDYMVVVLDVKMSILSSFICWKFKFFLSSFVYVSCSFEFWCIGIFSKLSMVVHM